MLNKCEWFLLKKNAPEKWVEITEANKLKNKEKVHCECGGIVSRGYLPTHLKSKKHKNLTEI